jgi:hypothetical protein
MLLVWADLRASGEVVSKHEALLGLRLFEGGVAFIREKVDVPRVRS